MRDECWLCGKELNEGDWVVEIVLKVKKEGKFVELGQNPYERVCLSCGLKHLHKYGINEENLDACVNWRKQLK
mgnify:CR=1 FL=1